MLGHTLYETRDFGFPLEYANTANLKKWKEITKKANFEELMHELFRIRTSKNGVFGIKIHYSHIKQFGGFDNLVKFFPNPHFVLLRRKELLKQAISLSIARQTGQWIASQKKLSETLNYDFEEILQNLKSINSENSNWKYLLETRSQKYIEIEYSDLISNIQCNLNKIYRFTGQAEPTNKIHKATTTKVQSDEINNEWYEKFLLDHQHRAAKSGWTLNRWKSIS
ncbi:hypothetical protein GCM10027567_06670 [Spongiibacter taiwanensis]